MLGCVPTLVIKRCRSVKDMHLVTHCLDPADDVGDIIVATPSGPPRPHTTHGATAPIPFAHNPPTAAAATTTATTTATATADRGTHAGTTSPTYPAHNAAPSPTPSADGAGGHPADTELAEPASTPVSRPATATPPLDGTAASAADAVQQVQAAASRFISTVTKPVPLVGEGAKSVRGGRGEDDEGRGSVELEDGVDWVEQAKLLKNVEYQARLEEEERLEEAARVERLEQAERLLEADNARLQAEAEKRAEQMQERENRRLRAIARKQSVDRAEEEAAAAVLVDSGQGARREKHDLAEQERQKRKARVAAMLAKVKTVDKLTVLGC